VGRGFAGPQGVGIGQENSPYHMGQGKNRVRQNHMGQGRRLHPLTLPHPIAIPNRNDITI